MAFKHRGHYHDLATEARACEQQAQAHAEALEAAAHPAHDDPCVCGPYDRCRAVRAADARAVAGQGSTAVFRALHRAYND